MQFGRHQIGGNKRGHTSARPINAHHRELAAQHPFHCTTVHTDPGRIHAHVIGNEEFQLPAIERELMPADSTIKRRRDDFWRATFNCDQGKAVQVVFAHLVFASGQIGNRFSIRAPHWLRVIAGKRGQLARNRSRLRFDNPDIRIGNPITVRSPVAAEGKHLAIGAPDGCCLVEIFCRDHFRFLGLDVVKIDAAALCTADVSCAIALEGVAVDHDGFWLLRYRSAIRLLFVFLVFFFLAQNQRQLL